VLLLSACQSIKRDLPDVSTVASAPSGLPQYRIQPGDVLESHFVVNPQLNEQVLVAPDGYVSFFGAPDIAAAGLTVRQLRETVASKARITESTFNIVLRNTVGTRIYVTGEVNAPGEIVVNGQISALQAISRAGGFKLGAQTGESVLIRHDATDKPIMYAINLAAATDGRKPEQDAPLQSYDILYVPRDRAANLSLVFERIRNAVPVSFFYGINRVNTGN
jgi:protein involved in polysaccharide export with SLBB domain